jgi:hypothetical protein
MLNPELARTLMMKVSPDSPLFVRNLRRALAEGAQTGLRQSPAPKPARREATRRVPEVIWRYAHSSMRIALLTPACLTEPQ